MKRGGLGLRRASALALPAHTPSPIVGWGMVEDEGLGSRQSGSGSQVWGEETDFDLQEAMRSLWLR